MENRVPNFLQSERSSPMRNVIAINRFTPDLHDACDVSQMLFGFPVSVKIHLLENDVLGEENQAW